MQREFPPIRGFIENTLIDWEGKIACEVFLPGCNLRCPFCHAADLVTDSDQLESIPVSDVTQCLDRHEGWLDGVVISGGDPTLHANLESLIHEFRSHGAMVKLDTNGTLPDVIEGLLQRNIIDAVSMDIKTALDQRYYRAAGTECDLDAIRRSTQMIMSSGIEYEFRTTVCPAFVGSDELQSIAKTVSGAEKYILQQFKPGNCLDPAMDQVEPYPREKLRQFAAELSQYVGLCVVRGDWPSDQEG